EKILFDGSEELAVYDKDNHLKMMRTAAFIELKGEVYTPLYDAARNLIRLIKDQKVTHKYSYSAFGELLECEESCFNPWRYAGKRYESELGLFDFGSRHYHPLMGRWTSHDPAGFLDSDLAP
ncbi:MAG: RHS repeat-associated core domain-containing protein, partial [Chlamydiia bacterium]|nr:RHS repeat-associated core domain-containing protein [Chlamydiia bacterium]